MKQEKMMRDWACIRAACPSIIKATKNSLEVPEVVDDVNAM